MRLSSKGSVVKLSYNFLNDIGEGYGFMPSLNLFHSWEQCGKNVLSKLAVLETVCLRYVQRQILMIFFSWIFPWKLYFHIRSIYILNHYQICYINFCWSQLKWINNNLHKKCRFFTYFEQQVPSISFFWKENSHILHIFCPKNLTGIFS